MDTEYYHEIKLIIFIHQQIHCTKYLIYIYLQSFEIYVIFRGKLKSLGLIKKTGTSGTQNNDRCY